jgi:uncharacterized SAM-binding protein YcdF (DUF218 family)
MEFLKSLPTLSNLFVIWVFLYLWLIFKAHNFDLFVLISVAICLLVRTTSYVPKLIVTTIEKHYSVLDPQTLDQNKTYFIHVLGAGYNLNPDLPALTQPESSSLSRLNEGIRVFRLLDKPILVTSSYSKYGLESQDSITRKAAIELGVSSQHIRMLENPSTTLEEAQAFKSRFGTSAQVIIATDAMHMSRAMDIYRDLGYEPIAAPTNFQVHFGPKAYNGFSMPNYHSFQLSNTVFRTVLKQGYYLSFRARR